MTIRETRDQQVINLDPLNGVFGYPPSTYVSDDMIINSMPVIEIFPSHPVFESGLTLFRITDAWEDYSAMLNNNGYKIKDQPRGPLKLAYIADSFPTESFSNDYGESFLQKFTDVASQGMSEIMQMTGSKTVGAGVDKMLAGLAQFGSQKDAGIAGTVVGGVAKGAQSSMEGLRAFKRSAQAGGAMGQAFGGAVDVIDKLMAGHRVDFPIIWRNAGFNPNYQITVRLYNPNPRSLRSTQENIIGPLASILLLALPGSMDGRTYTWPYFHKIKCSALFALDPAVITNITVVKGGDQQQIAYNQRVSIIDVRIDFRSVYNSMLFERANNAIAGRPILRNYLKQLGEDNPTVYRTRSSIRRTQANLAPGTPKPIGVPTPEEQLTATKNANIRARRPKTSVVEVTDRTSFCSKMLELSLLTSDLAQYKDGGFTIFSVGGMTIRIPDEVVEETFPGGITEEQMEQLAGSCTALQNAQ